MRRPSWLRRAPRGWPDVRRELEADGVPRVGMEPEGPAAQAHLARGRLGQHAGPLENHDVAHHYGEQVIDEEAIENAAGRLWEAAPADTRLFIFGSHAWARASARSDLNLLVIEPGEVEDPANEAVRLRRALRGLLIAADIIVVSAAAAREWRGVPNSLVGAALAEGRELTRQ
jgi:predicted nucleotidyltransferase